METKRNELKLEDYQVLSVLNLLETQWTAYKVRERETGRTFLWRAIKFEQWSEAIGKKIDQRVNQVHPNLIKLHDCIVHDESKTIYLILDDKRCLGELIDECLSQKKQFSEPFLWKLLYKLGLLVRKCPKNESFNVLENINDVFVDVQDLKDDNEEFELQLMNFQLYANKKKVFGGNCLRNIGRIMFQMVFTSLSYERGLIGEFPLSYSQDLEHLLEFLVRNDSEDSKSAIESVLRHPTVLQMQKCLKQDWFLCTVKDTVVDDKKTENFDDEAAKKTSENIIREKLETLRKKEAHLKDFELRLQEKEHNLMIREKRVLLAERMVREKTTRAELYLKCARKEKSKVPKFELNSSLSAAENSSLEKPTSEMLTFKKAPNIPNKFALEKQRKRVKFKGHSPLKDIHNNIIGKRNNTTVINKKETIIGSATKDKKKNKTSLRETRGLFKRKSIMGALFSSSSSCPSTSEAEPSLSTTTGALAKSSCSEASSVTYEEIEDKEVQHCNNDDGGNEEQFTNKEKEREVWPLECKKQAFQLLRLMNEGGEDCVQIRHTFL